MAVAALRSSTNELLPVRYIDTELNKQFPDASDLKQNKSMLKCIYSGFLYVNGISLIMFTKTLNYFLQDCFDISFDNI